MTAVSLKGGLSIYLGLADPHRWSGRPSPLGRAPMRAAVPRVCVFFATASFAAAVARGGPLRPRRGWRRGRARPGEGRGAAEHRGRGRRAFMWRFARANRIWLQALQICSPPRREPHACDFVHGWPGAARAAHFETLAAYGRLYLIARARHRGTSTRGRPDPLLSPSRRRRSFGAAPMARHSL